MTELKRRGGNGGTTPPSWHTHPPSPPVLGWVGGVWALFGAMAPCVTRRLAGGGLAWVDVMGNKWGRQKKVLNQNPKTIAALRARILFVKKNSIMRV